MSRCFQARCAKYSNCHVIEATAPIAAKFCTTIKILLPKYYYNSATVSPTRMKFNMMMYINSAEATVFFKF